MHSEQFRQSLITFLALCDRNGVWTDADCDAEDMDRTTVETAVPIVARWIMDEIEADIASGIIPAGVRSFAELHDYVDANTYGSSDKLTHDDVSEVCEFWNAVHAAVSELLTAR